MEENICKGPKGLVSIFDEVAIQTRILALNLALESGQGECVKKISKGIFAKAVGLCDAVEITAQEVSSLLKNLSSKPSDSGSAKTIAKLDEFAEHIGEMISLAAQNRGKNGKEPPSSNKKIGSETALFYKTFEIQNMLKRFRSDIVQPATVS